MKRFERAKPGWWYYTNPNGFLFYISDKEQLSKRKRRRAIRRSKKNLHRLGYKIVI